MNRGKKLLERSRTLIELHEGYIQLGGDRVGESFVRAMVELADRLFPTGWRVSNGFVVPSNHDTPSRTAEWLTALEEERAAKGLNPDGTRKKKQRATTKKRKPMARTRQLKRREKKPKAISLKKRRT